MGEGAYGDTASAGGDPLGVSDTRGAAGKGLSEGLQGHEGVGSAGLRPPDSGWGHTRGRDSLEARGGGGDMRGTLGGAKSLCLTAPASGGGGRAGGHFHLTLHPPTSAPPGWEPLILPLALPHWGILPLELLMGQHPPP